MNKDAVLKALSAASVVLGLALPASALSVGGSAGADIGVDVDTSPISAQIGSDAQASVNAAIDATAGASADAGAAASASIFPIMLTRADVESNATGTAMAPSDVHEDAQLSTFIASELRADPDLEEVQATDDALSITYRLPARLLGLIPVSVQATALVASNGDVTVSYPWYSFLLDTDRAELENKLQARVDSTVGDTGELNAQARAQVISSLRSVLGGVDASAQAQASAGANL